MKVTIRAFWPLLKTSKRLRKMWNSYIEFENSSRRLIPWNGGLLLKCGESGTGKPLSENFPAGMNMELQTQTPRSIFRTFCFTMDELFSNWDWLQRGIFFCTYAMKKTCRHLFDTNSNYPFLASKQMIAASINWMQYLFDCTFSFRAFAEVFCQQVAGPEIRHLSIYQSPNTQIVTKYGKAPLLNHLKDTPHMKQGWRNPETCLPSTWVTMFAFAKTILMPIVIKNCKFENQELWVW